MSTDTTILDPVAVEKFEATAGLAEVSKMVALYERAAEVEARKLAALKAETLDPILSELGMLRIQKERAQARLDVAEYLEVSSSEDGRQRHFRMVESTALGAYRRAQSTPGSPKERIEAEWGAVVNAYAASKQAIGLLRVDGTVLTTSEHEATFYKRFVAVRHVMERFTGLSAEEQQAA